MNSQWQQTRMKENYSHDYRDLWLKILKAIEIPENQKMNCMFYEDRKGEQKNKIHRNSRVKISKRIIVGQDQLTSLLKVYYYS